MSNYFTVNKTKYEGTKQEAELQYEGRSDFNYKQTFEEFVEENCDPVFIKPEPPVFTEAERKFLDFQNGLSGSFYKSLVRTIMTADEGNQSLLAKGFPELVEVVRRFQKEEGYWQQLEGRWNKFTNGK